MNDFGLWGSFFSFSLASSGVRSPFFALHLRQLHTTFSHVERPPRERGRT